MNSYTYLRGNQTVRSRKGFYIGSSDIPTILGLTPSTPMDLWRVKTGRDEPFHGNMATHWGNELEGIVLKNAIQKMGDPSEAQNFFIDYSRNMYRRANNWLPKTLYEPFTECIPPDQQWMVAHADCIVAPENTVSWEIIEAKTGGFFGNIRRDDMDGYDKKDPTSSGVPFKVFFQVQWQMACYDIHTATVAALLNTNEFSTYAIEGNSKIQAKLIEAGSRMMYCLERDIPPTPKTFGDIKHLFPELNDNRLTVMGERAAIGWDLKERLKRVRAKLKKGGKEKDDIMNALGLLIGDNLIMADEMGNKICSQSKFSKANMLSPKKIKESCPEAYELLDAEGLITSHEERRLNA